MASPVHLSFPNKQKSAEPSPTVMSSSLGSNLSELDRLLLELNAVQHNPPGFPAGRTGPLAPLDLPAGLWIPGGIRAEQPFSLALPR